MDTWAVDVAAANAYVVAQSAALETARAEADDRRREVERKGGGDKGRRSWIVYKNQGVN